MEPPGWQDKGLVAHSTCLCWESRAEPSLEVSSCTVTGAPAGSEGLADTLLQHPQGKSQTTLDCATQCSCELGSLLPGQVSYSSAVPAARLGKAMSRDPEGTGRKVER